MSEQKKDVRLWEEELPLPTYAPEQPEKLPMFYELRNYQNAKGDIYPLPATEKISGEKKDEIYHAVRLENEYTRVTVLPELGGRIWEGYDKAGDYNFVYKNNVMKPALVGLCGPWVSGGIEFNWPQHHRPTTYMPVEHVVEENADGSRTVWVGEVEPKDGLKGMIGITVEPGRSYIKAKVRLYNPTPVTRTFHWWANLAVHVGDGYQLQFPPDIDYITYHYKDAVSPFPVAKGEFARVDFGEKGEDITWYKNIHGPASFFIFNSNYNFMGGYDHDKHRGTVHVADRHLSPGKKFFTWGNGEFGDAWQKNLTDADGPYIEIMTGCYTDNQPDFCFLAPYETKTFEQYWYSLTDMPHLRNAGLDAAVSLELDGSRALLAFNATSERKGARYVLREGNSVIAEGTLDIAPDRPFSAVVEAPHELRWEDISAALYDSEGNELISYRQQEKYFADKTPPKAHTPAPEPRDVETNEELYLQGLHLEQYRHPTLDPEAYYLEALRRDPLDSRCLEAMARRELLRRNPEKAEEYLRRALEREVLRNPNPRSGEVYYLLGCALRRQGKETAALDAFQKAAWDGAWAAASLHESAELAVRLGRTADALDYIRRTLERSAHSSKTLLLESVILRRLGRKEEAEAVCREALAWDPLGGGFLNELWLLTGAEEYRARLDALLEGNALWQRQTAAEYLDFGCWKEAAEILEKSERDLLRECYLAYALRRMGGEADAVLKGAAALSVDGCMPWSLCDEAVLAEAAETGLCPPAEYVLGNLFYAAGNAEKADRLWEACERRMPDLAPLHRARALAAFEHFGDTAGALRHMERAFALDSTHPRLLLEYVLLQKALRYAPEERLALLEKHPAMLPERDDLYVEYLSLLNLCGREEDAAKGMASHVFHTYEGGEGVLPAQRIVTYVRLGRRAWERGENEEALRLFMEAIDYPENFNEGRKYQAREGAAYWHIAEALTRLGRGGEAAAWYERCIRLPGGEDESEYYKALALRALGEERRAREVLYGMISCAEEKLAGERRFPYFEYFPTGAPFHQSVRRIVSAKGYTALALAHHGLGHAMEEREARAALAEYTVDTPWVNIICGK